MIKIEKQFEFGKYTILCLDKQPPTNRGKIVTIGGKQYETEIVYDLPNSIGVVGHGNFVDKEVIF